MAKRVEVGITDDGRAVALSHVSGTEAASTLAAEAERLSLAAHPGVVEVVRFEPQPDGATLATAWASGGTLADALPLGRPRALRLASAVATTLADLHERGITHGRLSAEHVLLDASDMPRLCGFGPTDPADPVADVAAFGTLLEQLVARPPLDALRAGSDGPLDWDLSALADRARSDGPDRPSAAALAASLRALTSATDDRKPHRPGTPSKPRRRAMVLGGAGAAAVVLVGVATAMGPVSSDPEAAPPAATTTVVVREMELPPSASVEPEPPATAVASTTTSSAAATTTSNSVAPATSVAPPTTGGRLGGPATTTGNVVQLGDGRRFTVGRPGDVVIVGDWDCDGDPSAAVLRPSTGEVFVFGSWPAPGEVAAMPARSVVVDAVGFHAGAHPSGDEACAELAVRTPTGIEPIGGTP